MDDHANALPSPAESSTSCKHHGTYYFDDRTVIFLVEDRLFGLHRSTFQRHSPVFKQMWTLPIPAGTQGEGNTDHHPIRLEGVTVKDFESFLCILYPPRYGFSALHTLAEWQSVIDLATQWEFDDIRALALREIQKLDLSPAQKISLSHRYDIRHDWRLPSLVYLCEQPDPPPLDEARILGLENLLLIMRVRERLKAILSTAEIDCYNCRSGDAQELGCKSCGVNLEAFVTAGETSDATRIVSEIFNIG